MSIKLLIKKAFVVILGMVVFSACSTNKAASKSSKESEVVLSPEDHQLFTTIFLDASRAKILGNNKEAIYLFKRALDIDPSSGATKYEIARIEAQMGNYLGALPYAQSALENDPENIWFADFLGQLYAELGQLDQSAEVFKTIIKVHPEQYDYYFTLGNLLSAQGKFDEALELYKDLEKEVGMSEELTLQRQMIYVEQGDFETALKEIDMLIAASPGEVRFRGMKAEILEQMGREDEAIQIYLDILEVEPSNGLVLISLYEMSLNQGDQAAADKYLNQAFASPELGIDVKVNILLNAMAGPDFEQKKSELLSLANNLELAHPEDAKTYAVHGDLLFNYGDFEASRVKFRKAVAIDPNRAPIWQQIITIDSQLYDFEAMKTESAEAMELFPQQPVFYLFHGIALLQNDETEQAIEVLNIGKNLVVDNGGALAQFYASLGDAYHELDKHKKSDDAYDKALKYDPNNVVVLNNFAYYLSLRKENLERAEVMAKKANNLSPNQATFQDTYAWVLYCRENFQNALFWIEEALKYGGDTDPVVHEHHGDILLAVNRSQDAVKAWQKAIELGGDLDLLQKKIDSNIE